MVPDALEDGAENGGKTGLSRDAGLGSKTDRDVFNSSGLFHAWSFHAWWMRGQNVNII
jgi:hypothetical protein